MADLARPASREILLSLWKIHILHHAAEGPVYGRWIAEELRRHGYAISPGTLYPLLARMERAGWLARAGGRSKNPKARKPYRLTAGGRKVLDLLRRQVDELRREISGKAKKR